MKKILFAVAMLIISASCKKSNENPIDDFPQTELPELAEIPEISLLEPQFSEPLWPQGDVNFNLLGYGYDVTGEYNDAGSVRASVMDINSFSKDHTVDPPTSTAFWSDTFDGKDAEDLVSQLSNQIADTEGRKLYGKTISSFFPESPFSEGYIYGFYSKNSQYKRLRFYPDNYIKDYLNPEFQADLKSMNAEALVKKYGTHMLIDISLGAKLNVIYQAETEASNRIAVQHAGYDAALKTIFGMYTNRWDDVDSTLLRKIKSPKLAFKAIGGDVSKIRILHTTGGPRVDINDWLRSCSLDNAVLIIVNKVVPLSMLIDNDSKKDEVENYIAAYLSKNEVKISR